MPFVVAPFSAEHHLAGAVQVLLAVRRSDPTYPAPQDADATPESLTTWLLADQALSRWVALVDGAVVGHVLLCEPHVYLTRHLDQLGPRAGGRTERGVVEIAKLFVSPSHRREAVGRALLRTACQAARASGKMPALAVVTTSRDALLLYESEGMEDVGGFVGVHGENRVLVQKPVDMPMEVGGGR